MVLKYLLSTFPLYTHHCHIILSKQKCWLLLIVVSTESQKRTSILQTTRPFLPARSTGMNRINLWPVMCYVKLLLSSGKTYTHHKSSKWYIVCICRGFQKGLIADEFYPSYNLECIIKTNYVFVHLKSSCQYRFTRKMMASKAKWRLKPESTRYRKCCASVNHFSEVSCSWLKKYT